MHPELTTLELRALERKLDERWADLQREVHDELKLSAGESGVDLVGRPASDACHPSVMDALADLNLASIERHIHEVRAIKVAKERLRDGTYGTCGRCDQPIGVARLLANPSVELCFMCQSQLDHVGEVRRRKPAEARQHNTD